MSADFFQNKEHDDDDDDDDDDDNDLLAFFIIPWLKIMIPQARTTMLTARQFCCLC